MASITFPKNIDQGILTLNIVNHDMHGTMRTTPEIQAFGEIQDTKMNDTNELNDERYPDNLKG